MSSEASALSWSTSTASYIFTARCIISYAQRELYLCFTSLLLRKSLGHLPMRIRYVGRRHGHAAFTFKKSSGTEPRPHFRIRLTLLINLLEVLMDFLFLYLCRYGKGHKSFPKVRTFNNKGRSDSAVRMCCDCEYNCVSGRLHAALVPSTFLLYIYTYTHALALLAIFRYSA